MGFMRSGVRVNSCLWELLEGFRELDASYRHNCMSRINKIDKGCKVLLNYIKSIYFL